MIEPVVGRVVLRALDGAKRVTAQALDGGGKPFGSPITAEKSGHDWIVAVGDPVTTWHVVNVER